MISATILTKNSEKHLKKVLEALKSLDEVVLLDTGSTDNTLEIAKNFPNTSLYTSEFLGFGQVHNIAANLAKHDWILSIDSDEIISSKLLQEIQNSKLNKRCVYSFPRLNYYCNKQIKWCGWYPERVTRLYNKTTTKFSEDKVHEKVLKVNMSEIKLTNPVHHYPYSSIADFLTKMQHYSTLFAEQNKDKKKSSVFKAISHGLFAFFKSYILKRGFLGGYEGFLISTYNGNTAFYKYLKLFEKIT
ncbi:MAG: glycosyltransferase family 2 protein [Chlamydiales bacterium]|nr:glycosyltransferase family 2 protein [Chlamydiales bacterium]